MSALNAGAFVTLVPNYFGKGPSLEKALKAMRDAGAPRTKQEVTVYAIACQPKDVQIFAHVHCEICWPRDAVAMKFTARL